MFLKKLFLVAASAALFSACSVMPSGNAASAAPEVAAAAERLRIAMIDPTAPALGALVADDLSYGHSGGVIQDKKDFVEVIASKKTVYKSIELSKQTVSVAGNNAIVRHAWESESGTGDGKWNVSKIGVLQVWQKDPGGWKLLARQAFKV